MTRMRERMRERRHVATHILNRLPNTAFFTPIAPFRSLPLPHIRSV
jgi:hypothetical protein